MCAFLQDPKYFFTDEITVIGSLVQLTEQFLAILTLLKQTGSHIIKVSTGLLMIKVYSYYSSEHLYSQ